MDLASRLDAVTVYARGAVCLRRAALTPAAGVSIRLVGLPLSLKPGSFRARVERSASTQRVLDVRAGFEVKLPEQVDVPKEQKALELAVDSLARLQQELARVEREIHELQSLRPKFPAAVAGQPPRTAPVAALLAASDFTASQLTGRFEQRRALQQQVEDASHTVELHQRRLQEASNANRTERVQLSRTALVTLAEAAAEGELLLEYFVPGARWAPSYDLHLAHGLAGGALTMRAAIAQRTGEDWVGVKLALSTASLDRRTELPELRSLRIGRAQPKPPRSGWREPPAGLEELFEGFDVARSLRPSPAPLPQGAPKAGKGKARKDTSSMTMAGSFGGPAGAMPPPAQMMMPPPAPMAAPVSAAAPMRSMARPGSSGGGGAELGASRARHAAPEMAKKAMMRFDEGAASADMAADEVDDEAPSGAFAMPGDELSIEPAASLMDYDALEMPSALSADRGRLQAVPSERMYLLAVSQVSVQVNVVMALIGEATDRAVNVESMPWPRGAIAPTAGSFDYRYDCDHRVDVPSTGGWTMVSVATADVGLAAEYSCVPSIESNVYRTLKVHNRSAHALLRGPVDVSVGDEFLLTAELPLIAPGSNDARLGLGVEEAIKVSRKTHFKEGTGGLLGGSTVLPHDIEIEVNNRLPAVAQIEVRERIPVSDLSDVKIEEVRVVPLWDKDEQPRDGVVTAGARAWNLTLQPGEKTTLTAQYVIRIPSDKMLVGGNRRV